MVIAQHPLAGGQGLFVQVPRAVQLAETAKGGGEVVHGYQGVG